MRDNFFKFAGTDLQVMYASVFVEERKKVRGHVFINALRRVRGTIR